jgi:hypothetical protein
LAPFHDLVSMMKIAAVFAAGAMLTSTTSAVDPATLVCMGTRGAGAPVVILEAGGGSRVETWAKVQGAVAEFAHVCAYDRPALRRHWTNDEPPAAAGPDAVVETLDTVLAKAGERPPYV